MQGLATQKGPSAKVVLPHYGFAALSYLGMAVLIILGPESFAGHYFHPKLLAIVHLAALGWGTMIIYGALYQLLPVVLEVALFSEKLATATFYIFCTGVLLLIYSFWNFAVGLEMQVGASLVFLGFLLFSINVYITSSKTAKWKIEADFIISSCIWLLLTGFLGVLMVFNFRFPFLPQTHLVYLKMHAHMGMAGWFLLLIIGVGSKLLPMFLLAHHLNMKKLTISFYLINGGVLALQVDWLLIHSPFIPLYAIIIVVGIGFFLSYIFEAFRKRLRKTLDISMKQSMFSMLMLLLPLMLGIYLSSQQTENALVLKLTLTYGFIIFFGFITSLILGQTFKTLPFIVWMHQYQNLVGKTKTPLPKELFSEKVAAGHFYSYVIGFLLIITGIFVRNDVAIISGGFGILISAFLYNWNVFKVLLHKSKIGSNGTVEKV